MYFAATAVFAGALPPNWQHYIDQHERAIPIAMFQGREDEVVPLTMARETRNLLEQSGLDVEWHEMRANHVYWNYAEELNPQIWGFLRENALEGDPVFKEYKIEKGAAPRKK